MSTLAVNQITTQTGDTITLPTGKKIVGTDAASIVAPGHVIQTVTGTYDTLTSTTSKTPTTAISVNITPSSTSSKILVMMQTWAWHNNYYTGYLGIFRGSTDITLGTGNATDGNWSSGGYQGSGIGVRTAESYNLQSGNSGTAANWAPFSFSHTILDSPSSTSQQTYALKFWTNDGGVGTSNPLYINRANNISNSPRPISTLTLQEIAG